MAKSIRTNATAWTKLAKDGTSPPLSTSVARMVTHAVGRNGVPIVLRQFDTDPAHPFTAGQMVFTHSTEQTIHGERHVAVTENFEHGLFYDQNQGLDGEINSGGLFLPESTGYRVPLEFLVQLYTSTNPAGKRLQINFERRDGLVIDEDDLSDITMTIDPNTEDDTDTAIQITAGSGTPAGERGGYVVTVDLTDAQYDDLVPRNAQNVVTHNKIGITIAEASSVDALTYSAYNETHAGVDTGEIYLRRHEGIALKASDSGDRTWYARLDMAESDPAYHTAYGLTNVGD